MRRGLVALVCGVVVAGCGTGGSEGGDGDQAPRWQRSSTPIDASGIVYADEDEVVLGDGTRIDTGDPVSQFLIAGDGVYFTASEDEGEDSYGLQFATADEFMDTGLVPESFVTSPDRRYLAVLHQPDLDGMITTVVVDLERGREVVRSQAGMGDEEDDLRDLYEDSAPGIIGFSKTDVYVGTTDGVLAFDLRTGDHEEVDSSDRYNSDWYRDLERTPEPDTVNEAGTWELRNGRTFAEPPVLVPASGGAPVVTRMAPTDPEALPDFDPPDYGRRQLDRWLDDTTVLASAPGPERAGIGSAVLITCAVPSGVCTPIEETVGGVVLPRAPQSPRLLDR